MRIPSSFSKDFFRGHLANISNNLLITAINSENGEMNKVSLKFNNQFV
jgi:aconitate hydratase